MSLEKEVKILIVEDNMIIAADMSMKLTKLGYQVIGIHNRAEDALKTVSENRPDVIIMDIVLSGTMNGIDAALEIKERHAIPVIFLTSNADDATFQRAKKAQPYGFISKPFRTDDLSRAIELTVERVEAEVHKTDTLDQVSKLEDRLFIRHMDKMIMVPIDDILLLEADRNYCSIITKDQKFLVSVPLGNIEDVLPKDNFIRTHRSFIVNILQVKELGENLEYLMVGTHQVPVSRRLKEDVMKRFKTL